MAMVTLEKAEECANSYTVAILDIAIDRRDRTAKGEVLDDASRRRAIADAWGNYRQCIRS